VGHLFRTARRGTYDEFVAVHDPARANAADSTGSTLLHAALANKPPERARIAGRLLDDGADAAAVTRAGATTAHVLLGSARLDAATDAPLLRRLLDGGCDPNRSHGRFGTPLMTLARQLTFTDAELAPFYDVLLDAPGLDPLAPPPPERSTLEAVTLLGEQRADLARRLTDLLHERAATEGAAAGTPAVADRAAALAVATGVLAELERDLGRPLALWEGDPDVEPVADHGDVWVVMWNSVDYLRSKDFSEQVLMGPVVVPKDGRPWFVPPTAYPTEEALDRWRRGAL